MPARLHRLLLACALIASPAVAAADEPTPADRALATQLFNDGRALMEQHRYPEACRKLEESQRLVPGGGTLLNLAICHEAEGKLATAWAELHQARGLARQAGRPEREELAQRHIDAVEPRLPRVVVVVPVAADLPDLTIVLDGTQAGRATWTSAMPVDPGKHVIEARAAGRRPWTVRIELREGERREVVIQVLERAPAQPAKVSPPPSTPPKPIPALPGAIALGIGSGGILLGSIFGLVTMGKRKQSDALCTPVCSDAGFDRNDDAKRFAAASTASFILGGAGVAAGITVLALRARARPGAEPARVVVAPSGGPRGGSIDIAATW